MKKYKLGSPQICSICRSLEQLCHAGIPFGDALTLMADDESSPEERDLLQAMAQCADGGGSLAQCFRSTGRFPLYVCELIALGEQLGRTEDCLGALACYYDRRSRMMRQMKSTMLQPLVLALVMLAVLVVLLIWVLPVFEDIYSQLGGSMSGMAAGLLVLGKALGVSLPWLCLLLAAVLVATVVLSKQAVLRDGILRSLYGWLGDKGVFCRINSARFLQALAMGLRSGMNEYQAVELAVRLVGEGGRIRARCKRCLSMMDEGRELSDALRDTELLSAPECRLLYVGIKSGSGEVIMDQIAQRALECSEHELETLAEKLESAVVVLISLMVGGIVLSVMLPLINIMNAIG